MDAAGKYFIGPDEVPADQLLTTLLNHAENELDRRIHVRADKNLPYRTVLEVMGQISAAGFSKVALVSEAPAGAPRRQAGTAARKVPAAGSQCRPPASANQHAGWAEPLARR